MYEEEPEVEYLDEDSNSPDEEDLIKSVEQYEEDDTDYEALEKSDEDAYDKAFVISRKRK
jgi:hypothetical protein